MSYHRRKVKGTLHRVSARHGLRAEVRLYDRLFFKKDPDEDKAVDFKANPNPDSLTVLPDCVLEPSLAVNAVGRHFQFERRGCFYADPVSCVDGKLNFNRTEGLRDTWNKVQGGSTIPLSHVIAGGRMLLPLPRRPGSWTVVFQAVSNWRQETC